MGVYVYGYPVSRENFSIHFFIYEYNITMYVRVPLVMDLSANLSIINVRIIMSQSVLVQNNDII